MILIKNNFMTRVVLMIVLVVSMPAFAEGRTSFSSDELFEKSIRDLRKTMEKVRSSNEIFKEQNRALQKQANDLEQEISDLDDQGSAAQKQVRIYHNQATLSDKENALYQARVKSLSIRLSRLSDDKKRYQKKIKFFYDDNIKTKKLIAELKEDVVNLSTNAAANNSNAIDSAAVSQDLADRKNRIMVLQKQLDSQNQIYQAKSGETESLETENASLVEALRSAQDDLSRVTSESKLISRAIVARNNISPEADAKLRNEIANLQDYRDGLRRSLQNLRVAISATKSVNSRDLENIFKQLEQHNSLLVEEMNALKSRNDNAAFAQSKQAKTALLNRRKNLLAQKSSLEAKIIAARKESEMKEAVVPSSERDLSGIKAKIKKSEDYSASLQKQINTITLVLTPDKKSQDLEDQIVQAEKHLQVLRAYKVPVPDEGALELQDTVALKNEIARLESRRSILADTVKAIDSKYKLNDISSNDPADKEAQLKEYWKALKIENNALQEKFLILQMREDKKGISSR